MAEKKTNKKKFGTALSNDKIMYILSILDKNEGNVTITAKECEVSRPTVIKYQREKWREYLAWKNTNVQQQEKVKIVQAAISRADSNIILTELEMVVLASIAEFAAKLEQHKVSARDLNMFIGNALPFLAEKKGEPDGSNPDDIKVRKQMFIQNIFNMKNITNNK